MHKRGLKHHHFFLSHHKARAVNERLRQGVQAGHFNLVDNDKNLYLMNSSIDDSLFWRDKLHLNKRGATRLIANFGVSDSVQVNIDKTPVINRSTVNSTSAYRGGTGANYRSAPSTGRQTRDATGGSRQARQGVNPPADATRSRSDTSGGCVFCAERNHTWETCRHGTYITCDRCSRPAGSVVRRHRKLAIQCKSHANLLQLSFAVVQRGCNICGARNHNANPLKIATTGLDLLQAPLHSGHAKRMKCKQLLQRGPSCLFKQLPIY